VEFLLEDAPEHGFEWAELQGFPRQLRTGDPLDPAALNAQMADAGLKTAAVYGPGFGGASEEQVAASITNAARMIRIAAEMGTDTFVASGGAPKAQASVGSAITVLGAVAPDAEAAGVKICVEPHYGSCIETAGDYDRIFAAIDSPNVGICVDNGHFDKAGVDTLALMEKYRQKIWHLHVKDQKAGEGMGLGEGELDLAALIELLKGISFDGFLSIELEVEDKTDISGIMGRSKKHLEGLL
jgi:inosose dehydratase